MKTREWYGPPHNAWFDGKVKSVMRGGDTIIEYLGHPGEETQLDSIEGREAVDVRPLAEWKRLVLEVKNGIGYLRNRLAGNCEAPYDCSQMFQVYHLVQAFDPSFASQHVTAAWVDAFTAIPPLAEHIPNLKLELPAYLSHCAGTIYDHTDVGKFTADVLLFWANHGKLFPTWAIAMQIVGSCTPYSAAAERVFSLRKLMFGDLQMSALADMIQAAMMLTTCSSAHYSALPYSLLTTHYSLLTNINQY